MTRVVCVRCAPVVEMSLVCVFHSPVPVLVVCRSTTFSPEELLGMILNNTRAFAQEHAGVCVGGGVVCVCVCMSHNVCVYMNTYLVCVVYLS